MEVKNLIKLWNDVAARRKYEFACLPADMRLRLYKALSHVPILDKSQLIIDIGCGDGHALHLLKLNGFDRLVGIEISVIRLRRAKEKFPYEASLIVADGLNLPFRSHSFDIVLCIAVIEHVQKMEHVQNQFKLISEIARVVKPSGHIILITDCYFYKIQKMLGFYRPDFPIDNAPFPLRLIKNFSKAGLGLVDYDAWGDAFLHLKVALIGIIGLLLRIAPEGMKIRMRKTALKFYKPRWNTQDLIGEIKTTKNMFRKLLKLFYKAESIYYLRASHGN
jgi:SAM-dependent methyltransferase